MHLSEKISSNWATWGSDNRVKTKLTKSFYKVKSGERAVPGGGRERVEFLGKIKDLEHRIVCILRAVGVLRKMVCTSRKQRWRWRYQLPSFSEGLSQHTQYLSTVRYTSPMVLRKSLCNDQLTKTVTQQGFQWSQWRRKMQTLQN